MFSSTDFRILWLGDCKGKTPTLTGRGLGVVWGRSSDKYIEWGGRQHTWGRSSEERLRSSPQAWPYIQDKQT